MSGWRLPDGGAIDRSRPLPFSFDGKALSGFAGDTLASALLASGLRVLGRSFKYHRPRGLWGFGGEEPNAIFDVTEEGVTTPNLRATLTPLRAGMAARFGQYLARRRARPLPVARSGAALPARRVLLQDLQGIGLDALGRDGSPHGRALAGSIPAINLPPTRPK